MGTNPSTVMPMEDLMNVTIDDLKNDELNEILADFMKKEHTFDHGTETLLKVLYTLLIVSGILANIVIIGVIIVNKRLFTSNNILLINLFVSDILLCIFCMPFTLIAITRRSWPFGAAICKLVPFIQAVTTFVSAVTISSIAIDRMFQITANQYSVRGLVTQSSPKLMKYGFYTLIIWIISMLLSAPICVYQSVVGFGIKELILYDKCVENWPNNNRGIYSFVILITQLLIPSCVMLVSHYRIRSHLNSNRIIRWSNYHFRQHSSSSSIHSINNNNNDENIRNTIVESQANTSVANCFLSPTCEKNYFDKELHRNNRITIFLVTLTVIFGVSWLPWNLYNIYVDFNSDINLSTRDLYLLLAICHLIAMSSATTNAIFYGFLHTAIRRELRATLIKIKQHFH